MLLERLEVKVKKDQTFKKRFLGKKLEENEEIREETAKREG